MSSGKLDPAAAKEVVEQFTSEMKADSTSMRKVLEGKEDCCLCLNSLAIGQEVHCYQPCRHIIHASCSAKYLKTLSEEEKPIICPYCRQPATIDELVLDYGSDLLFTDPDPERVIKLPSDDEEGK